ncbi:MAG: 23S rRNA (adenine(2030)-N(6))-methyltransferase RlmJ [Burkholderiaceae bacterium]|nr:23S rRNA (adenine(2030)-N(6))-methyltransferase RlmJ [Burkholderiaceae bacterium]
MFSYRHAFHAGNHADVLKHMVLVQLLAYLNQKDAAYMVIDTHAGAGVYTLDGEYATKSGEADEGIAKLWARSDLPAAVAAYVSEIRAMNPAGKLRHYPGSPFLAERVMREQDRLRLFELHSTDSKLLVENVRKLEAHAAANGVRSRGKRILAERADGFAALKALLPPPSRRGLVLIDPPYEDKDDYRKVRAALEDAQKRFAGGTYAVWYPALGRLESQQLPERLKRVAQGDWLHVTLSIGAPNPEERGLTASGMFVINPPWTLEATLKDTMPWLVQALARDGSARYTLHTGAATRPVKERA